MHIRPYRGVLRVLVLVLLLGACATPEPVKLYDPRVATPELVAVLFSFNVYKKGILERMNTVFVTKVDDTRIDDEHAWPYLPLELLPGRHVVEIRYERDSLLCGYFGCVRFKQATESLVLHAEPGHSYIPFASKYCNKNWIWIEDRGVSAKDDLQSWSSRHGKKDIAAVNVKAFNSSDSKLVVAGEPPSGICD